MCRIAGFWDFNYRGNLAHGGPDDGGIFLEPSYGLALTDRRLSILDLSSAGHQPMEFKNLVITYNGEVYSFREIRQELEKEGYKFSSSDTEVILKAFHRWGFEAVHRFRGMFAFALWDKKEKKLILCRDRIGVKPLYYYTKDELFMTASELKAFHKHPKFKKELSPLALSLFLCFFNMAISLPHTAYLKTPISLSSGTS
ncbi:hypothetical protein [Thermosynechococcus sp. M3746_W2019_013]|uniref:asparagine synthetase B family protein n=2 Tax=unclassified Thermosynechococcus TaxID=2622553 RepID=UPI0025DCB91B|nr:hypothetical protein [Thermosynechococcus sp. M3746_W2019_013]